MKYKINSCLDPEHRPPSYLCLKPGQIYIHTCPSCGAKTPMMQSPVVRFQNQELNLTDYGSW